MRTALLLAAALSLSACGLHPLYAGGGSGAVATALGQVEVAPIEGKSGWLMATALRDRLQATGTPLYRLDIRLDDQISGLGVRRDDSVSRERRVLRARYQLVRLSDGSVLLDVPHRQGELTAFLETRGFARERSLTRMALANTSPNLDGSVHAIAGPELG